MVLNIMGISIIGFNIMGKPNRIGSPIQNTAGTMPNPATLFNCLDLQKINAIKQGKSRLAPPPNLALCINEYSITFGSVFPKFHASRLAALAVNASGWINAEIVEAADKYKTAK